MTTPFALLNKRAASENEGGDSLLHNLAVGGAAGAGAATGTAATGAGLTLAGLKDWIDSGKGKMLQSGTPLPGKAGYTGPGKLTGALLKHPGKAMAGGGLIAALLAGLAAHKTVPRDI